MAVKRLGKEHQAFQKDPPPFIWARPNESKCVPLPLLLLLLVVTFTKARSVPSLALLLAIRPR